ncbi:MAG: acyltransferase [Chloroflexi bacterium]|nr:acyltransferase [Chloroflexota bacterium]
MSAPSAPRRRLTSHGDGRFTLDQFARLGENVIIEAGVLVFHPENIEIGDEVYIGHNTILKGYHLNRMVIANGVWIGQQCFFHSAGGISIGKHTGLAPGVKILTSAHSLAELDLPILHSPLHFAAVSIGEGSDIGVGAIILPGVTIGRGVQIGAGAVVTASLPDYAVAAGNPARILRYRRKADPVYD